MIQLGQIGEDKLANLVHAREMVRRAAEGGDAGPAQIVMLPVPFTFVSLPHMSGRASAEASLDSAGNLQLADGRGGLQAER